MDAWVAQLKNSANAGSYSLSCSIEELFTCARAANLVCFEVPLQGVKGKQHFLAALATAFNFPPEFGMNWDALADALCDLSWCDVPSGSTAGYVFLLRNAKNNLGLSSNDREIAQDIFADTVLYWQQRNKPFWIFYA